MKTTFIRKPESKELIPQDEFTIDKVVEIDPDLFTCFIHNPLDDYDFIKENEELMFVDENEIWHCILVKAKGHDYGILVNSEGSSYARYASAVPLILLEDK